MLDGPQPDAKLGQLAVLHLLYRQPWLNKQYSVWGQVISGMDNVDKIKKGEPVKDPDSIVSMKLAANA